VKRILLSLLVVSLVISLCVMVNDITSGQLLIEISSLGFIVILVWFVLLQMSMGYSEIDES